MPEAAEILRGLTRVAVGAVGVSIGWHLAVGAAAMALLLGFRPEKRLAAMGLSAPLASVGALALLFGNPFNGAIFSLLAGGLAVLAWRAPRGRAVRGQRWAVVLGSALMVFGLTYPHFLDGAPWFTYLYAAPLGAIPCPTLAVVIGAALAADGFGLRAWRLTLAAAGSFYALFGVLRLGVLLDVVLLIGAVGLFVQYVKDPSRERIDLAAPSV